MIEYEIVAYAKKYKRIHGYKAVSQSSNTFLSHVAKKFQRKEKDVFGNHYYIPYFSTLDLLKARSRGHISVEFVRVVIRKERGELV